MKKLLLILFVPSVVAAAIFLVSYLQDLTYMLFSWLAPNLAHTLNFFWWVTFFIASIIAFACFVAEEC